MTATTEADAPDETATDSAISAVQSVAAEQLSGGQDDTAWLAVLSATVGPVLFAYLSKATEDLFRASGQQPGPDTRKRLIQASQDATDDMVARAADIAREYVTDAKSVTDPAETAHRLEVVSGELARAVIVPGRESARFKAADNLGAIYKVWRTRHDARVRPAHGDLEGNRIPLGNMFVTIEGDELRYPGDPLAPIRATANCRCRLSYLVPR